MEDRLGRRQADDNGLDCEKPARLQGVALERHCKRKNELEDEHPARNERTVDDDDRIDDQKNDDRQFVPTRRITEKIFPQSFCHRVKHKYIRVTARNFERQILVGLDRHANYRPHR